MSVTKIVVNCETGVTEEIELTAEELAEMETNQAQFLEEKQQREAELAAKESARLSALAKLAELGLTPEEAAAL